MFEPSHKGCKCYFTSLFLLEYMFHLGHPTSSRFTYDLCED